MRLPLALLLALTTASCTRPLPDPLPGFPRLVLWAWERPENLSYIVPSMTGVAYLAGTLILDGLTQTFVRVRVSNPSMYLLVHP